MAEPFAHPKLEAMFAAFAERPTVEHVSRTCGVHHATVRKYRVREGWDARLATLRADVRAQVDYDLSTAMADSLRLVRKYKEKLTIALAGKRVAGSEVTASELERVIRLEAFVLGGVESRHEVVTEFSAWTDEELESFARDGTQPRSKSVRTS